MAPIGAWDDLRPEAVGFFEMMYSEVGEKLVLEENFIIEKELPICMLRQLTDEEMNIYRKPYLEPGESRRPSIDQPG